MATYYTIHCYKAYTGEDILDSYALYTTFEKACDVIDECIRRHLESWNDKHPDEEDEFILPDRKEMFENFAGNYLHYFETQSERTYVICKRQVVGEKPKKYVYQYWVENKICGLHTKSDKYASFDEACDALDNELRELHAGSYWEPRMSRDEFRVYMGEGIAATYDFFKEDKYVLSRQQV